MKAIKVAKNGGPEELQLQEVAQPAAGEVLVRVHRAEVNHADIYFRTAHCSGQFRFRPRSDSTP